MSAWREFPDSSHLEKALYDAQRRTLTVKFRKGAHPYRYEDFGPAAYTALLEAPSAGKHFHGHIKGQYLSYREPPEENS